MTTEYRDPQDINHCSTRDQKYRFYCIDCFADYESECICDRVVAYHAITGHPIVDMTDEESAYLNNQNVEVGDS